MELLDNEEGMGGNWGGRVGRRQVGGNSQHQVLGELLEFVSCWGAGGACTTPGLCSGDTITLLQPCPKSSTDPPPG